MTTEKKIIKKRRMKKAKYVLELENHTFLALSNDIRQKRISGSHHAKDDITIAAYNYA